MITNKDIRVENGFLIINGDKFPLDGQSPETIMEIVEDNSDSTPTENSTAPVTSGGVYTALDTINDTIGDITQTGLTGDSVAEQLKDLNDDLVLERFTPTLASALGTPTHFDHNCFYNPKTKQVHIQVMIYSPDALIPTAGQTVFTVDTKYRPAADLQLGMAFVMSSAKFESRTTQMERCLMGSNGAFSLNNFVYGPQATKILYIVGDYIAA